LNYTRESRQRSDTHGFTADRVLTSGRLCDVGHRITSVHQR
jgi:hypothetical protein